MEHNFDNEDLAVFHRSLWLLHSPKIDSQRKLYHLLQQSIRKHHPTSKYGKGKKMSDSASNVLAGSKDYQLCISQGYNTKSDVKYRDPRLNKEQNPISKTINSNCNPMHEITSDIGSDLHPNTSRSGETLVGQQENPKFTDKIKSDNDLKTKLNFPSNDISTSLKSFNFSPKKTLGSNLSKCQTNNSRQLPQRHLTKSLARHNYCPSPINLKKIRAVLARGDPFPTYLTKACMNNITPDLQREKL